MGWDGVCSEQLPRRRRRLQGGGGVGHCLPSESTSFNAQMGHRESAGRTRGKVRNLMPGCKL